MREKGKKLEPFFKKKSSSSHHDVEAKKTVVIILGLLNPLPFRFLLRFLLPYKLT